MCEIIYFYIISHKYNELFFFIFMDLIFFFKRFLKRSEGFLTVIFKEKFPTRRETTGNTISAASEIWISVGSSVVEKEGANHQREGTQLATPNLPQAKYGLVLVVVVLRKRAQIIKEKEHNQGEAGHVCLNLNFRKKFLQNFPWVYT